MSESKMIFTEYELVIDENRMPQINIFKNIHDDDYEFNGTLYKINCEIIDNKYFWLYARSGKAKPYSSEVININTKETDKNPRNPNQAELRKQTFCLYCPNIGVFYVSNSKSSTFVLSYLKLKFEKNFSLKNYFVSPDEFVKAINSVKSLKFVSMEPNLFNGDIFSEINDVLGYGKNAHDFTLEVKIKENIFKPETWLQFLTKWKSKKDSQAIKRMICVGKDDKGIKKIFNLDNYLQKCEILAAKDENEMFNPNDIKQAIIGKIDV